MSIVNSINLHHVVKVYVLNGTNWSKLIFTDKEGKSFEANVFDMEIKIIGQPIGEVT